MVMGLSHVLTAAGSQGPVPELLQDKSEISEMDGRRGLPLVSHWGSEVEPSAV